VRNFLNQVILLKLFHIVFLILVFSNCGFTGECEGKIEEYNVYTPKTFLPFSELVAPYSAEPKALIKPGKIYIKDEYLFISEKNKGVHIINNADPAKPQKVAFINILGNIDIAVKDNILYADSYFDLLGIDISDPKSIKIAGKLENFFIGFEVEKEIYWLDPNETYYHPEKGIVVDWHKEVKEHNPIKEFNTDEDGNVSPGCLLPAGAAMGAAGKGGSIARLTIVKNYLYVLDAENIFQNINYSAVRDRLHTVNIENSTEPKKMNTQEIFGRALETIFPYKQDKLFLGSQFGMFVYDISNLSMPTYVSRFKHFRSCDPVVAENNFAYVTLRNGTNCGRSTNELDIIDISQLTSPVLVKSYPMNGPSGLGIDQGNLFICDGSAGLKVFNATDPRDIQLRSQITNFECNDVIPNNNVLIVTADDGIFQYDYTDINDMLFLSTIPIE